MTHRADFGEASGWSRSGSKPSHDLLPDGPQTMTGGGMCGEIPRCLVARRAWSGCLILLATFHLARGGESAPRIHETIGLKPDDFITDSTPFAPDSLVGNPKPWTASAETSAPSSGPPRTPSTSPVNQPPLHPPTAAKWVGVLGFVLLLLRHSHRHR